VWRSGCIDRVINWQRRLTGRVRYSADEPGRATGNGAVAASVTVLGHAIELLDSDKGNNGEATATPVPIEEAAPGVDFLDEVGERSGGVGWKCTIGGVPQVRRRTSTWCKTSCLGHLEGKPLTCSCTLLT